MHSTPARPDDEEIPGAMHAVFLLRQGEFELRQVPVPHPCDGEVLVRMTLASICGSDVHNALDGFHNPDALGRAPGYPGHEGVGVVAKSRSPHFRPGQRVLTVPSSSTGGCFAEYLCVKDAFLLSLPAGLPDATALMAQQLGTTVFGMKSFWPGPAGETAVVLGTGSAGQFFVQLLRSKGFERIIVAEPQARRRAVAARLGGERTTVTEPGELLSTVHELTNGVGADLVIEAAGLDECRRQAITAVRPRGTVGMFGFPEPPGSMMFPLFESFRKAVSVLFVSNTQEEPGLSSFREGIELLAEGRIDISGFTDHPKSLAEVPDALRDARDARGAIKTLITLT
jgi:L-iditol 2-dehydrogenase